MYHLPASTVIIRRPGCLSIHTLPPAHHPPTRPGLFGSQFQNHRLCLVDLSLKSEPVGSSSIACLSLAIFSGRKQDCLSFSLVFAFPLLLIPCNSVVPATAVLSSVAGPSRAWRFKSKRIRMKNAVPRSQLPYFCGSVATDG